MSGQLIEQHRLPSGVEFLVLRGELGGSVLYDVGYSGEAGWDEFLAEFEIDSTDYLGDPTDTFYQGIVFTRVVRRRSDGVLFGASWWGSPGNDGVEWQTVEQPDLESIGVPWDWESDEPLPVIFVPVEGFTRIGFRVENPF